MRRTVDLMVRFVCETKGVWEVAFTGGIWTTVYPADLPRKPKPGDVIRVRIPQATGYVYAEATP